MDQALVPLTGLRQRLQSNHGVHVTKSERRARAPTKLGDEPEAGFGGSIRDSVSASFIR